MRQQMECKEEKVRIKKVKKVKKEAGVHLILSLTQKKKQNER